MWTCFLCLSQLGTMWKSNCPSKIKNCLCYVWWQQLLQSYYVFFFLNSWLHLIQVVQVLKTEAALDNTFYWIAVLVLVDFFLISPAIFSQKQWRSWRCYLPNKMWKIVVFLAAFVLFFSFSSVLKFLQIRKWGVGFWDLILHVFREV